MKYKASFKKNWRIIFVFLSILVFVIILQSSNAGVRLGQQDFQLETTETYEQKEKGLSNRTSLDKNTGMIFESGGDKEMCMWMKNMKFDIAMIWVLDGRIEYIEPNVSMNSYPETYCHRANYVIELNVDDFARSGLKVGDQLSL